MDSIIITALSSSLLIAISVIGYLYNRAATQMDEELFLLNKKHDNLSKSMQAGFEAMQRTMSEFNTRVGIGETRTANFADRCDDIISDAAKKFDKITQIEEQLDTRITAVEQTVATHDLRIAKLEKDHEKLHPARPDTGRRSAQR